MCGGHTPRESLKFSALVEVKKELPVVSKRQYEHLSSAGLLLIYAHYRTTVTAPVGEINMYIMNYTTIPECWTYSSTLCQYAFIMSVQTSPSWMNAAAFLDADCFSPGRDSS